MNHDNVFTEIDNDDNDEWGRKTTRKTVNKQTNTHNLRTGYTTSYMNPVIYFTKAKQSNVFNCQDFIKISNDLSSIRPYGTIFNGDYVKFD